MNREASASDEKERFRRHIFEEYHGAPPFLPENETGRIAQKLRGIPEYRGAATVLISLHPGLRQVGLNVLADRKKLVLPTPGLQKGFVLIDPAAVPPQKRHLAVRPLLNNPLGMKLPYNKPLACPIDLVVCEALCIGKDGTRLGDGKGHLDLQYAILFTLGWLSTTLHVIAPADEGQILPSVPVEQTDVGVHLIVTPREVIRTPCQELPRCGIIWEKLSKKQIRRNEALFHLNRLGKDSAHMIE